MTIEKEPFRMYRSEEEIAKDKEKSKTLTLRLNAKEQELVKELMKAFNVHMETTAIKIAMKIGKNVLHGTIGADNMRYLTDPSRRRLELD